MAEDSKEIFIRTITLVELTTDEAVQKILERNALSGAIVQDFREVLEKLIEKVPDKELYIEDCRILDCTCNGLEIPNKLTIHHTSFEREVNFGGAIFKGETVISYVTFNHNAFFRGAVFENKTRFTEARFTISADFGWTEFKNDASFCGAKFSFKSQYHNFFDKSKIYGLCDFNGAEFSENTRIDFSKVDLRPGGRIFLSIKQLRKGHFLSGEDSGECDKLQSAAEQYNLLRDNFKILPSTDRQEDLCHYKYKDLSRRATKGKKLWKLWDWAIMKWCLGYGIYTKRVIFAALALIIAFAGVYHSFADEAHIKDFDQEFNSLYFSVITFTTIGYGDYAPLGWFRVIAGLEGLLGLIVIAVFTISFARKFIR